MFCSACGAEVREGAGYCAGCGAAVTPEATARTIAGPQARPSVIMTLAVLKGISAVAWLAVGLGLLGFASSEGRSAWLSIAAAVLLLGMARAACAYGLWTLRPYGRVLQIALSCLGLLVFPIQTAISVLILVYMVKPGTRVLFSGKRVEDLTEAEKEHLRPLYAPGATAIVVVICIAVPVFLVFGGIVSAIAIPNLLNAIDRGKQKRTMADLTSIGTAVESYRADRGAYPDASSIEELRSALEPKFIVTLPVNDGWGHPFAVRTTAGSSLVFSLGKDGVGTDCSPGRTSTFADQICFADGQFVRYPEGLQR